MFQASKERRVSPASGFGITLDEQTTAAYATVASSSIACSYSFVEEFDGREDRCSGRLAARMAAHPISLFRVETKISEMTVANAEPTLLIGGTIPVSSNPPAKDSAVHWVGG